MPKLALISPKGVDYTHDQHLLKFLQSDTSMQNIRRMWNSPNLGLLVLAAVTPSEWEIDYIDEHHVEIDFSKQYDIVGISCMTQQICRGYEIASEFRSRGVITVIGGIHATTCVEEVKKYTDVVIVGEGESLWPQVLDDWKHNKLKHVYQEDNPGTYDITLSPVPRYELIKNYPYDTITINTSRGCNHNCSFCAASKVYGSRYRRKTNEQIIEEIKEIVSIFPNRYILFGDDNLFVSRKECKELLDEMKTLNIRWAAQSDISIAEDIELVKQMAESGCIWLVVGLESVNEENLVGVEVWKAKRVKNYKQAIATIQRYGVGVMGAFVVGLDHDEKEDIDKTINFINECNFYGIHVTSPTPFPGTRFRQEIIEQGRLVNKTWSCYTHWDVVIYPKKMTIEDLENSIYKIYQSFSSEDNMRSRFISFMNKKREQQKDSLL